MAKCKFCDAYILRSSDTCLDCAKKILAGETLSMIGGKVQKPKAISEKKPKKKPAANITTMTMDECRRLGYECEKCEYWLASHVAQDIVGKVRVLDQQGPAADWAGVLKPLAAAVRKNPGVRKDIFGFVDVLAITDEGLIGIQSTTAENVSARVKKIREEFPEIARRWLNSGNQIEVWGWKKYEKAGDNGRFWQVERRLISHASLVSTLPF